ncbi:SDR family NAD(P)-dependent oxidoreductase, partial [Klebsiella pneumoniae]|uniref:SDR family NAD(P)-dependent oxidoreductase n=1 Tax=Klebsiella pneumoniae TaxID=573 RepID=UPI0027300232
DRLSGGDRAKTDRVAAPFHLLGRVGDPHMVAAGGGAVVNFTSISSEAAQTGRWLYPASKAAMKQLTRSMAMDLAADGVRGNSVCPGWTGA